jgi:acyl-CoA thioesterase I
MPARWNNFKSGLRANWLTGGLIVTILASGACRQAGQSAAGVSDSPTPALTAATPDERPILLAFGDSLTAGYGLPADEAYPTLLQKKIDAAGYRYRVVNAGVSGDTTAGGLRRLEWSLEGPVKVMVLALGGNDGLRGQPVAEMKANLAKMIEIASSRGVRVVLPVWRLHPIWAPTTRAVSGRPTVILPGSTTRH